MKNIIKILLSFVLILSLIISANVTSLAYDYYDRRWETHQTSYIRNKIEAIITGLTVAELKDIIK